MAIPLLRAYTRLEPWGIYMLFKIYCVIRTIVINGNTDIRFASFRY